MYSRRPGLASGLRLYTTNPLNPKTKGARAPEGNRTPVSCLGSTSTNHCATSATV